jgi:hypothetical protein
VDRVNQLWKDFDERRAQWKEDQLLDELVKAAILEFLICEELAEGAMPV